MPRIPYCLLLILFTAQAAVAGELVREFSGDRSTDTAEFEVEAPWLIDWWVNSDYPQSMGVAIALVDARRGTHEGRVVKTKAPGNGLRLIEQGGVFRFKVDATVARWRIKVEQLTREEAEQYTPRNADQPE
jgi:hypothetical protein